MNRHVWMRLFLFIHIFLLFLVTTCSMVLWDSCFIFVKRTPPEHVTGCIKGRGGSNHQHSSLFVSSKQTLLPSSNPMSLPRSFVSKMFAERTLSLRNVCHVFQEKETLNLREECKYLREESSNVCTGWKEKDQISKYDIAICNWIENRTFVLEPNRVREWIKRNAGYFSEYIRNVQW